MPELTWISTCKHVTADLRNNKGYFDVYVDNRATSMYSEGRCTKIMVWVPALSANVEQNACVCFIRSSILSLDISHDYVQFKRKIMIYPKNITTLMVFEENRRGNYYPLEIYRNRRWENYNPIDERIFTTPLPQSYGEFSNLQAILSAIFYDLSLHRYILIYVYFVIKTFSYLNY